MIDIPIDDVLAALTAKGCQPKNRGTYWSAKCPCHDDTQASLSIKQYPDGGLGAKCFSTACEVHAGGTAVLLDYLDIKLGWPRKTTITYRDVTGRAKYQVVRVDHENGEKEISQHPVDDDGKPLKGAKMSTVKMLLYRMDELAKAKESGQFKTFHIAEGEKCADMIVRKWREPATTNSGGSSAPWQDEWSCIFEGVDVVIWQDNDTPGEKWADRVAESVALYANSVSIRVPAIDEEGADVADMIARKMPRDAYVERRKLMTSWPIPIKSLRDVVSSPVEWLIPGVAPKGEITIVEGAPGIGKTMAILAMVAALTIPGAPLPHGEVNTGDGDIWYITTEDRADVLIKPRLDRIGCDPNKIIVTDDWDGCFDPDGLARFLSMMRRLRPRLVVIDAFLDMVLPAVDSDSPQKVKPILRALRRSMAEHDSVLIAIRHVTKASSKMKSVDLEDGWGGSHYSQAARGQIRCVPGDVPGTIKLLQVKNNYGVTEPAFSGSLGATLEDFWSEPGDWLQTGGEPMLVAKELMESALMVGPVATDQLKRLMEQNGLYGGIVFDVKQSGILPIKSTKTASGVWIWSLLDQ